MMCLRKLLPDLLNNIHNNIILLIISIIYRINEFSYDEDNTVN